MARDYAREAVAKRLSSYDKYYVSVAREIQKLFGILDNELGKDRKFKYDRFYRQGTKLNMNKAMQFRMTRDDKIWEKRAKPTKRSFKFVLALDESGSMGGSGSEQARNAIKCAVLLQEVFSMLDIDFCILGYSRAPSVHKDFNEDLKHKNKDELAGEMEAYYNRGESNDEVYALKMAMDKLETQSSDTKVVLFITDGMACTGCGKVEFEKTLMEAAQKRIQVAGIGLGDGTEDVIKQFYNPGVHAKTPEELVPVIAKLLVDIIVYKKYTPNYRAAGEEPEKYLVKRKWGASSGRVVPAVVAALGSSLLAPSTASAAEISRKAVETLSTWGMWGLVVFGVLVLAAVVYVAAIKRKFSKYPEVLLNIFAGTEKAINKIEAQAAIVIGVTGKPERVIERLNQNRSIGGVKVVALDGDEGENLKTLEKAAGEAGAYGQGIIDGENLTVKDVANAIKGMIEAIEERDKRAFALTDADAVSLKGKEDGTIEEILADLREVTDRLPVIKWVGISETSVYNLRMTKRAARMADGYVLEDRTRSMVSMEGGKGVMSVRADSLGELKILAEAHKKRMGLDARKLEKSPVRLAVRLALSEEDLARVKSAGIQHFLEEMDITDAVKAEDVQAMTKEEADNMAATDIHADIAGRYTGIKDIVVVDKARDTRNSKEAEGVVLVEYKGSVTARVYDVALDILANISEEGIDTIAGKMAQLLKRGKFWVLLNPMERFDTRELRNELERYHEVMIRA